jgi:hypothetical protein
MPDLFQDPTTKIPKSDPNIVRVDMEEQEIGGRKSHLPREKTGPTMTIEHVPNKD